MSICRFVRREIDLDPRVVLRGSTGRVTDVVAPKPAARRERDALDRFIADRRRSRSLALIVLSVILLAGRPCGRRRTVFTDELRVGAALARDRRRPGHAARRGEPISLQVALRVSDRARLVDPTRPHTAYTDDQVPERGRDGVGGDSDVFFLARRLVSPTAAAIAALADDAHPGASSTHAVPAPEVARLPVRSRSSPRGCRALARKRGGRRWTHRDDRARAASAVEVRKSSSCCAGCGVARSRRPWLWVFGPRGAAHPHELERVETRLGAALLARRRSVARGQPHRQPARRSSGRSTASTTGSRMWTLRPRRRRRRSRSASGILPVIARARRRSGCPSGAATRAAARSPRSSAASILIFVASTRP